MLEGELHMFNIDDQYEILQAMGQSNERATAFANLPLVETKLEVFMRLSPGDQGRCIVKTDGEERARLYALLDPAQRKLMLNAMSSKDRNILLLNKQKSWMSDTFNSMSDTMRNVILGSAGSAGGIYTLLLFVCFFCLYLSCYVPLYPSLFTCMFLFYSFLKHFFSPFLCLSCKKLYRCTHVE